MRRWPGTIQRFSLVAAAFAVLTLACPSARAGDAVTFSATVGQTTVELGSALQLMLTLTGTDHVSPVTLPAINGFQSRYVGPSTNISIINGQYSRSTTFIYNLYPLKVGTFTVPSIKTTVGGKTYTTDPITIKVVNTGSLKQGTSGGGAVSLKDKIFVTMHTPSRDVYLNAKVPIIIRVFISGLSVRNISYPTFDHAGFMTDHFTKPRQYEQTVNGLPCRVVEFRTFVYPLRTGPLDLGPAREVLNILFKTSGGQMPNPFGNFFNDSFFNNVFQSYDTRSVTLTSQKFALHVLPLPAAGQPKGFSGGIGRFDFKMSVGPTDVKVGDPVTVQMSVTGEGNLRSLTLPAFQNNSDFKFYQPEVKQSGDRKTAEQVAIPTNAQVKALPAVTFSYFDPQDGRYHAVTRGPFPLHVTPLRNGGGFKVVGLQKPGRPVYVQEETLGKDIVFIKEMPGTFYRKGEVVREGVWYGLAWVLVIGLWAGTWGVYRFRRKMRTDLTYARSWQAPRQAKKGLQTAAQHLAAGEQSAFYDVLFKTLQQYFAGKCRIPQGSVGGERVLAQVLAHGLPEEEARKAKDLLDECDMVRYASASVERARMEHHYRSAKEIIDYLERHWS